MQCVILAAGRGQRMRPLTDVVPKPLVQVAGKTILDHIVEALPKEIDELILVVGYKAEQIRKHCGEEFHGRTVTYVEQDDFAGGTGDALLCAANEIKGKFLFMYADDIHGHRALQRVVQEEHAMLGMNSDTPERFGVLVQNSDGTLKEVIEKPEYFVSNLVNIGGFVVDRSILEYKAEISRFGEILVTDMLTEYAKANPVKIIEQDLWIPVGCPEDVKKAEQKLSAVG
jgi:NDP-sugar pyrophosphorylase family protein